MNEQINHRDLEMCIGGNRDCDDYLKLKVVGYYPMYNNITIAARHGEDHFRLSARGPKTDLSDAIALDSRYLVIGDMDAIDERIFNACVLQNKSDIWLEVPDDLYITRLLIAGAIRIIVNSLPNPLAQTPEYKQAVLDKRVINVTC